MKVQFVDPVIGKQVYITLHSSCIDPRAGHVQHHAAVREARRVLDLRAGDLDRKRTVLGVYFGGQQPEQGLHAVEYAAVRTARDFDPLREHRQAEGFAAQRRIGRKHDRVVGRHTVAGRFDVDIFAQVGGQRRQRRFVTEHRPGADAAGALVEGLTGRRRLGVCREAGAEHPCKGQQVSQFHGGTEFCFGQSYFFSAELLPLLKINSGMDGRAQADRPTPLPEQPLP